MHRFSRFPSLAATLLLFTGLACLAGCEGQIDVVDAGTYSGTIDKVKAGEKEIYVSLDSGQRLELYFTDTTQLLKAGSPAPFAELEAGQKISVTVTRTGNRNDPTVVEIMS